MELDTKRLSELLMLISEYLAKQDRGFNSDIAALFKGWLKDETLSEDQRKSIQDWSFTFNGK